MRYTEKDLKTKYDNFTEYLSSIMELLILSPFRLVNEISKKVVYLEKQRIEKMLITSIVIAILILLLEFIIGISLTGIDLFGGRFPLVVQAITPLLLIILLGFVKTYDFSVLSEFSEILNNSKENIIDSTSNDEQEDKSEDRVQENKELDFDSDQNYQTDLSNLNAMELSDIDPEDLRGNQLDEIMKEMGVEEFNQEDDDDDRNIDELRYDCAGIDPKQFINEELLNNEDIHCYQNRHESTVTKLQERDTIGFKNSMFDDNELEVIQKMCDAAVQESKYVDDSAIEIMLNNQTFDDFSQVDDFMQEDNVDWLQGI